MLLGLSKAWLNEPCDGPTKDAHHKRKKIGLWGPHNQLIWVTIYYQSTSVYMQNKALTANQGGGYFIFCNYRFSMLYTSTSRGILNSGFQLLAKGMISQSESKSPSHLLRGKLWLIKLACLKLKQRGQVFTCSVKS